MYIILCLLSIYYKDNIISIISHNNIMIIKIILSRLYINNYYKD